MSNALYRILGVGEGSCIAPAIWTAVLDTILWLDAKNYTAFNIEIPTGKQTERLGDAYVDNIVLMANHQPSPDATEKK